PPDRMLPAAPPASRPPNPPFMRSERPPPPPPGRPALTVFGVGRGVAVFGVAPGWPLPPKCLTAFQASKARIAIVIGDIPPPSDWGPGLEGPRGPFCMPLRTSSRPMVFSCRGYCPREKIAAAHDGYKAGHLPRIGTACSFCYRCRAFGGEDKMSDRPIG